VPRITDHLHLVFIHTHTMSDTKNPNVLLFGAGGVGAVYLYLLSRVSSITAVCRSNYDVVKSKGFVVNSEIFGQNLHFTPNVVKDCFEAAGTTDRPYDFIVVCSKAIPDTIPGLIAPAVTPGHTVICLVQNGIGIEQEYVDKFPNNEIVSCVVYLPATQRPAGVVTHGELERLEIGVFPPSAPSTQAKKFQELMQSAGSTAVFHEDIQLRRWTKLLVNAPWNPICALTQCTDSEFMTSSADATDLVFAVMKEVVELAQTYGTDLTIEEAKMQLERATARIQRGTSVEPSMLQDVRLGRKTEVDSILGNAVRLGRAKGVECPKIEMLYILVKALDSQMKGPRFEG